MESTKDRYFVDGFMIRHFNIFPAGFDKENLFNEQKIFLIYLIAAVPDIENWKLNVDYRIKLEQIKKIKDVKLNQTEIDLGQIKGESLKDIQRRQLLNEKKRLIQELNKKFGIEDTEEEIEKVVETKTDKNDNNPKYLWDVLNGKGLVK